MEDKRSRNCLANLVGMIVLLILLIFVPSSVWAQSTTAQISGTVTDQSGAVLPGVQVTVTQTGTGISRSTVTNETGSYLLPNLPIGPYRLEATLPGFRTYTQTGITLQVGSNPTIDVVLQVGQVSETVEVQADANLVETRSTGVNQTIDNVRVLEMPLNGRQVTELILLSGAASTSVQGTLNPGTRNYPTTIINVAGGMQTGLTYTLDGANHNDAYNNLNYPLPFPDALQEFKVETGGLEANYGFHSSGQVNAITKAGTNEFHGDLFEFVRNASLNARNAFAITNDGLKRHQFGGTIGGPIIRNKLFFFVAEQGTKQNSLQTPTFAYIPTPAMMAGDFTTFASPACNSGRTLTLRAPFVNNKIDPGLFSKVAVNIVNHNLFPKTSDPCGQIRYAGVVNTKEWITPARVDYQLSNKQSVFARYLDAWREAPSDYDGKNALTATLGNVHYRVHTLALGETYLLSPKAVASFRGGLKRAWIPKEVPHFFDLTSVGVNGIYDPHPGYGQVTVSNGFSLGAGTATQGFENSTAFDLNEDLSVERGNHQLGLGVAWIHQNLNGRTGMAEQATPTFDGHFTSSGLADFMLGKASAFSQGNSIWFGIRQNYLAVYLKDTWKATRRLTLTGGLRWEPHYSPYRAQSDIAHFDRQWFDQGIKSSYYKNAPAGVQYIGLDPLYPTKGRKMDFDNWLYFAPRMGLAWDVRGDGRMTLRAAYGLFYDQTNAYHYGGDNPPIGNLVQTTDPIGGLDNPWLGFPGGSPIPTPFGPDAPFGQQVAILNYQFHLGSPYVHQWNVSLQRQIGQDWIVAANYIGNTLIHGQGAIEGNPAIYLPGASCVIAGQTYSPCSTNANTNQRRALFLANPAQGAYYSVIREFNSANTAHYDGMLLSIQRRRTRGLTVLANYSWAHCSSDPIAVGGNATGGQLVYPGRRHEERTFCLGTLKHIVNGSAVYELPGASRSVLRQLTTGWQLSTILRIQSGDYFTVTSSINTALTSGIGTTRVNQVLADTYLPNKGVNGYLNPAAFAIPALGTWGTASNYIQGPGFITITAGITRTFKVTESQAVQFRAEAFNLPNHMNPQNPNTVLNNPNFGKIFGANDPRILQFALKYTF